MTVSSTVTVCWPLPFFISLMKTVRAFFIDCLILVVLSTNQVRFITGYSLDEILDAIEFMKKYKLDTDVDFMKEFPMFEMNTDHHYDIVHHQSQTSKTLEDMEQEWEMWDQGVSLL